MGVCDRNFGLLAVFVSERLQLWAAASRDIVRENAACVFSYHGNDRDGQDPKSYYLNLFILLMLLIF